MGNNLHSDMKVGAMLGYATMTASADGAAVDTTGYSQALVVFKFGTTTGTSATFIIKLQESETSGGTYTDISGATSAALTLDSGGQSNKTAAVWCDLKRRTSTKEFIRYSIVVAGTSPVGGICAAILLLGTPGVSPATTQFDSFDGA